MTTDCNKVNVRVDAEIREWLDNQPLKFKLSPIIRDFLHSLMDEQGEIKDDK